MLLIIMFLQLAYNVNVLSLCIAISLSSLTVDLTTKMRGGLKKLVHLQLENIWCRLGGVKMYVCE